MPYLSVDLVLGFHARLMTGSATPGGRFKSHANYTLRTDGVRYDYVHPSLVGDAMRDWVEAFNAESSAPAANGAAELYARFQRIHPFDDGNGRVGRVPIAYWLHWRHGLSFRFYASDKIEHLRAIEQTDHDRHEPLIAFFQSRAAS